MTWQDMQMINSDMQFSTTRPTTSALLLLDFAAGQGLTPEAVLAGSHWTPAQLAAGPAEITAGEELHLIANVVAALGDRPGLGLEMGLRYHLATYGIWGFALMSAPTLRAAFDMGLRYLDLTYSYLAMRMTQEGDAVCLTLDASGLPEPLRRFLIERDMAALMVIQRDLFIHALPPRRIELVVQPPADTGPYQRLFGVLPEFDSPANRVSFDADMLDQPLPQANPMTLQLAETQCRKLLTQRRVRSGMAMQVRDALLRHIGGKLPDIEAIADELHLTSRTLRRRLVSEHTSYRALLDELRQTLAEAMLKTAGMKVAEVASRLGYAEAASFQHARKRWRDQRAWVG